MVTWQVSPYEAVTISAGVVALLLVVVTALYYSLKSRTTRISDVYLSGEPESVVSQLSVGVAALYWGFMKRFARVVFSTLTTRVHTGSLHDWYKFISSWFSLLLLISIVVFTVFLVIGD
ncbi:MAG: sodium:proton antiporter [Desulfurococcaceae archaeon]|jgi:hypothetical protein